MERTMRRIGRCLAVASALLALRAQAQEIKVGGLFDLTGITSDVGKPYAQGVQDGVAVVNANGGVNGKKIELVGVDYGYKIPEAVAAYKRLVQDEKVVMINGWGTGDTRALKDFVNKDKIPYFSASFAGDLTDPTKTPYNFFVAPSYSGPAPRLAHLGEGRLEGQEPQPEGRLLLRRQRLRQGAHRGRAAASARRTGSTSSTRRSSPATSRTRRASSST